VSWFEEHINWTTVIGIVASLLLYFILCFIFGSAHSSLFLFGVYEDFDIAIYRISITSLIICIISISLVVAWMIKKKNRSLWWLLCWLVPSPANYIVWLSMQNRTGEAPKESDEEFKKRIWLEYRQERAQANPERQAELDNRMSEWQELIASGWTPIQSYQYLINRKPAEYL